jgi:hypothetical protein
MRNLAEIVKYKDNIEPGHLHDFVMEFEEYVYRLNKYLEKLRRHGADVIDVKAEVAPPPPAQVFEGP